MKVSHLLLLVLPYAVFLLGAAANQAAIHANGGHMPVLFPGHGCMPERLDGDPVHVCMTHATHLKLLCDWVLSSKAVLSIGDVMMNISEDMRIPALVAFVALVVRDAFGKQV